MSANTDTNILANTGGVVNSESPFKSLKKLRASGLVRSEHVAALDQDVEEQKQTIESNVRLHAGYIAAGDDVYAYKAEEIMQEEREAIEVIKAAEETLPLAKTKLVLGYLDAMLKHFPLKATVHPDKVVVRALNHFADAGVAIDFFKAYDEGRYVVLPVTSEHGYEWIRLSSGHPEAGRIFASLHAILEERKKIRERELTAKNNKVAGPNSRPLLEVLKSGGEAVCLVPANVEAGGRRHAEIRLRIKVEQGSVTVLLALGNTFVEGLVGVSIPVNSIAEKRIDNEIFWSQPEDQRKKMTTLLRLLGVGIENAKAIAEAKISATTLKTRGNVSTEDFDRGAVGTAVVTLRKWEQHQWFPQSDGSFKRGRFVKEWGNVMFAVERNTNGEIRLVDCLKQHKDLFPIDSWKFAAEKSTEPTMQNIPYGGLGILGVMLKGIHYVLEGDRRKRIAEPAAAE